MMLVEDVQYKSSVFSSLAKIFPLYIVHQCGKEIYILSSVKSQIPLKNLIESIDLYPFLWWRWGDK